ncbi:hypothetical protein DYB32_007540 [Aphanomyces invadans]|uniref:Uncharacterized protein n=1 Tax=Aphanomyces invadans TaxID=157072 RepID=A0A418AN78_9STRA|nr:hypothetical protein DYB32_007540 [Aphanomyces invadans]
MAVHPSPPPAHYLYHRGESYFRLHNFQQAVDDFTTAIDIGGETPAVLNARGLAHKALGLYEAAIADFSAIADFTQVILHNPTNAHAHFRRAFAFKSVGRVAEAAADIETAKLLDPTNPHLMVNYKNLHDTECIVLCVPGHEVEY